MQAANAARRFAATTASLALPPACEYHQRVVSLHNERVMLRRKRPDALAVLLFFLLPLCLFAPQTLGGRTLIPTENLYQYEPWHGERHEVGAPQPHNALLSDLVLQNYNWQLFIREQLQAGELPLWNPYQFAGQPFFAAGQASVLYPLRLIFHLLPIPLAYGWHMVFNLWLAGLGMYFYLRTLRRGRFGALLAGIVYQLASWLVVSAVHPMIVSAAVWLPWLLGMMEGVIYRRPFLGSRRATLPWALGAVWALTCVTLAGIAEMIVYTALTAAIYGIGRLVGDWRRGWSWLLRRIAWLAGIAIFGVGLGAIQLLPLLGVAGNSYRATRAEYTTVVGEYAHPSRDLLLYLMPNIFGSPAQHRLYDWLDGEWVEDFAAGQDHTAWGIKNYVEGAVYLGILPLALALLALLARRKHRSPRWLMALLAALGASWMFGLPSYALLYFGVPGINQLHSPFRWVYVVSFALAALAGMGADELACNGKATQRWAKRIGWALLSVATAGAIVLLLSRTYYDTLAPGLETIHARISQAQVAFREVRWFYSHLFSNGLRFVIAAGLTGAVLHWGARTRSAHQQRNRWPRVSWQAAALFLIAGDLLWASVGFNSASNPTLLEHRPAAIEWLLQQPGDWRYTTLEARNRPHILQANAGTRYGLEDIRGFESIFPAHYVTLMQALSPQGELPYSRIAPLYGDPDGNDGWQAALASPVLELLNVRFVLAHPQFDLRPGDWQLRWEDANLRIWEMSLSRQLPRAYTVPRVDHALTAISRPTQFAPANVSWRSARELEVSAIATAPAYLILSQNYDRGWRAYAKDAAGEEQELAVVPAAVSLTAIELPAAGQYELRIIYSPRSFLLGGFLSFSSAALLVFAVGAALWRKYFLRARNGGGTARLARNSLAPILLNLLNRSIDFLFAAFMLRVISPEDAGLYRAAIVLFVIFEIFTNFGLNTLLTREAARSRARQRQLFGHTTALRLALFLLGSLPLTALILLRLNGIPAHLDPRGAWALALLYAGLLPGTVSAGLTALFYARERAEYPAAVSSLATLNKALLGVLLLVLGGGIVGLAALSILTNALTLLALLYGARVWLGRRAAETSIRWRLDLSLLRRLVSESWPLTLNHFLAQIFFQIDLLIIEIIHGTRMVAQYDIGYKWVLAVNVIPAFYTMALLPRLSRYARRDRKLLSASYLLSIKLLLALALPLAVWMTLAARTLTAILGGAQYLPDGALALQLMVWSIPIGWVNSLTQYALIAVDKQRRVTIAFLIATSFNIIVNLIFVPRYGFQAAALSTIASEAALLIPFLWVLRREMPGLNLATAGEMLWRPTLAGAGMLLAALALMAAGLSALALLLAPPVYIMFWWRLRPLNAAERRRLRPLVPMRLR